MEDKEDFRLEGSRIGCSLDSVFIKKGAKSPFLVVVLAREEFGWTGREKASLRSRDL